MPRLPSCCRSRSILLLIAIEWPLAMALASSTGSTGSRGIPAPLPTLLRCVLQNLVDVVFGDAWQPKSFIPGYTIVTKDNVDQVLKNAAQ